MAVVGSATIALAQAGHSREQAGSAAVHSVGARHCRAQMDCVQRRFLLAVISHALDANPANIAWFEAVTPAGHIDVLNFVNYDAGVQAGLLIEARAQDQLRTNEKRTRRARRKRRDAKDTTMTPHELAAALRFLANGWICQEIVCDEDCPVRPMRA